MKMRERLLRSLFDEAKGVCAYCKRQTHFPVILPPVKLPGAPVLPGALKATIDHKTPLSRGGGWDKGNLALACNGCNNLKASLTAEEFLRSGAVGQSSKSEP